MAVRPLVLLILEDQDPPHAVEVGQKISGNLLLRLEDDATLTAVRMTLSWARDVLEFESGHFVTSRDGRPEHTLFATREEAVNASGEGRCVSADNASLSDRSFRHRGRFVEMDDRGALEIAVDSNRWHRLESGDFLVARICWSVVGHPSDGVLCFRNEPAARFDRFTGGVWDEFARRRGVTPLLADTTGAPLVVETQDESGRHFRSRCDVAFACACLEVRK